MATNLTYAPGEGNISEATFSPSPIIFWLKVNMGVSSTRIVVRRPNTILGLIPLGYADNAYPLTNTASVGVSAKFSLGRLIFGLIFVIVGISLIVKNVAGIIFLLLGAAMLLAYTTPLSSSRTMAVERTLFPFRFSRSPSSSSFVS